MVLARFGSNPDDVVDNLTCWKVKNALVYTLKGLAFDPQMSAAITRLVAAKAFPGTDSVFIASEATPDTAVLIPCLHRLHSLGFVDLLEEHGHMTQWRFTSYGAHALLPARVVHSPFPAIHVRGGVPFAEMSSYELLRSLTERGWVWQQKPKRRPPAFSPGSPKVFYTSSLELPHAYALCLLQADVVFGLGATSIKHCQRSSYYKSLLQPPREPRSPDQGPRLKDDIHMGIEDGAEEIVDADDVRPDGFVIAELSSQGGIDSESGGETSGHETSGHTQVDEMPRPVCLEAHVCGNPPSPPFSAHPSRSLSCYSRFVFDFARGFAHVGRCSNLGRELYSSLVCSTRYPRECLRSTKNGQRPDAHTLTKAGVGSASGVEEMPSSAAGSGGMLMEVGDESLKAPPRLQPQDDAEIHVPSPTASIAPSEGMTSKRRRVVRAETIPDWGGFRLTWVPGGRGAWQAKCCYHKANLTTECTKRLSVAAGETPEKTLGLVKAWCLQAALHGRKRDHGAVHPRALPEMPGVCLDMELERMPPPPVPLKTDDELDAEDRDRATAASTQHPAGTTNGRAKAKSKQAVNAAWADLCGGVGFSGSLRDALGVVAMGAAYCWLWDSSVVPLSAAASFPTAHAGGPGRGSL